MCTCVCLIRSYFSLIHSHLVDSVSTSQRLSCFVFQDVFILLWLLLKLKFSNNICYCCFSFSLYKSLVFYFSPEALLELQKQCNKLHFWRTLKLSSLNVYLWFISPIIFVSPSQVLSNNGKYYLVWHQKNHFTLQKTWRKAYHIYYFFKDDIMTRVSKFVDISLYLKWSKPP